MHKIITALAAGLVLLANGRAAVAGSDQTSTEFVGHYAEWGTVEGKKEEHVGVSIEKNGQTYLLKADDDSYTGVGFGGGEMVCFSYKYKKGGIGLAMYQVAKTPKGLHFKGFYTEDPSDGKLYPSELETAPKPAAK